MAATVDGVKVGGRVIPNAVKLPDETIVSRQMINDLKMLWPRDENGKWVAPYELDHAVIAPGEKPCPNCHGPSGKGRIFAPTGDKKKHWSISNGFKIDRYWEAYPCPVCSTGVRQSRLIEISGLPDFDGMETDVWEFEGRETMIGPWREAQAQWTAGQVNDWLNLIGPRDSGKTWLSRLLVKHMVETGREARYTLASHLSDLAFKGLRQSDDPDEFLYPFFETPMLVIDEIFGVQQTSGGGNEVNFGLQHLIRLINHRYDNIKRLATVMIWDSDWWNISDLTGKLYPNITLAGDIGLILSRATEAKWNAYTTLTGLRAIKAEQKRGA